MATARTCAAIWLEYKSAPPALTVFVSEVFVSERRPSQH